MFCEPIRHRPGAFLPHGPRCRKLTPDMVSRTGVFKAVVPVLIIYGYGQKFMTEGLTLGSVKG